MDFLQRQTTNDVNQLQRNQYLFTVLTSPAARILDVFYVIADETGIPGGSEEVEQIMIVTLPGYEAKSAEYLRSRIFFMDKVTVFEESERFSQLDLLGPESKSVLKEMGISVPLEENGITSINLNDIDGWLFQQHRSIGSGYRLIFLESNTDIVIDLFKELSAFQMTESQFELFRIESGLPAPDHELTEDFTPLETELRGAISDTKGCYTGQEVIARQITYDKVGKGLCGLQVSGNIEAGQGLKDSGNPLGKITSVTVSPKFGTIALGIIKRPYNQVGKVLHLTGEGEETTDIEVVTIPFNEELVKHS